MEGRRVEEIKGVGAALVLLVRRRGFWGGAKG